MKKIYSKLNIVLSILLLIGITFSVIQIIRAQEPNPGHPWTEIGNGLFAVTGPTSLRTFTFPDANATVLTSHTPVTVSQGGTGLSSIAQGGILYASTDNTLSRIAPTAAHQVLRSTGANALEIGPLVAADIPNLDASKITSGTMATARLGSGTASSGTFLRGDSTWASVEVPSGTVILLYADETDSAETTNSTTETILKSWILPANNYTRIIVETELRGRVEQDAATKCDFTWRFKEGGTTRKTYIWRIIADSAAGIDSGGRYTSTLMTSFPGGQTSATTLSITGTMSLANAATGMLAHSFRVYGVK